MTKTELINSIADKANCTKKDAASALEATLAAIQEALENGEKVSITGFGTF
ncbi:MAG: HU family DNA-binding protein, partial [Ruminococcus sp.]|nr:HU family DNA-binding protein [Ruminococcus sp.]